MSGVEYAREEILRAFENKADIVRADGGIELVVRGGLKSSELMFVEVVLGTEGFRLDRIYYHRNRDALVLRFKPDGEKILRR